MGVRPIVVGCVGFACAAAGAAALRLGGAAPPARAPALARSIALPAAFEENRGQFDAAVRFLARTDGGNVFVARGEVVFAGGPRPVRMTVGGADPGAPVDGLDELPGRANYYYGTDPRAWRTDVPLFARVECRGVRPGVDLVGRFDGRRFEYDLVVAPGADPSAIALAFDGADDVRVAPDGDLVVAVGDWRMLQKRPAVFQTDGGARRPVDGRWVVDGRRLARFDVAGYDASRPLCIDPAVVYASYVGGNATEFGRALERDAAGNSYVAGRTASANFPTAQAYDSSYGGAGARALGDAFVAELNSAGTALVFATYLGGNGDDEATGIAVDATGVYVGGSTDSTSPQFPTTAGVIRETHGTGTDMFVAKFARAGNLRWSTLLDGGGNDECDALALDTAGSVYVTGKATSNMPTTNGAYQTTYGGGAPDGFVAGLGTAASPIAYATYLGGSGDDAGYAVRVDGAGNPYVLGNTTSADLGASAGALQTAYHGDGDAFLSTDPAVIVGRPPPVTVDAFFLPKSVIAKVDAKDATKSKLVASGFFDVGTKTSDLSHAGTLTVGPLVVPIPALVRAANGKSYAYKANGLVFSIVPDKSGSSRAKFTLKFGTGLDVTIPAAQFARKGDRYAFKGNASGVTSVVLDYLRETITVNGRGMTLGTFAAGSDSVTIAIGLGSDSRAVAVRAVDKGTTLKY